MPYFLRSHAKTFGPPTTLVKPVLAPLKFDFAALAKQAAWNSASIRLEDEGLGVVLPEKEGEGALASQKDGEGAPTPSQAAPLQVLPTPGLKRPGQSHANAQRAKRRKLQKQNSGPRPSSSTYAHVLSHGTAIEVDADAAEFPAAKGAVTGKAGTVDELGDAIERRKFYTVLELVEEKGFQHIEWDGKTPYPIIDRLSRIVAVLAGQPEGNFAEDLMKAHDTMKTEGAAVGLGKDSKEGVHLRGRFPAYNCGTTMGMGSPRPVVLKPKDEGQVVYRLLGHAAVIRMAKYQNFAFSLWAPRVYTEYEHVRDTIRSKLHLPENFHNNSVFTAAAFNFGGSVGTFKHRDALNWAFGWCAITALGRFDPTQSAHLILWELKLVINFPHAATALIPSAVVTHSNTAVAEGDDRGSFTQYTAGPIFRWVHNGCQTEEELKQRDPVRYKQMLAEKETAYLQRVCNFSTIEELCSLTD